MRAIRPALLHASGVTLTGLEDRTDMSALKMRRNKKQVTAAQAQGKVTGRWTEEEH